jgi:predicted  nucleic acid-binding Zn-ribbon protein
VQGHRREITMVRSERNIARKRWEDEKATSRALREQIAALETDLAAERARPETGMEAVSRRIAKVKSDPVKSTRAIARRLRGH